MATVYIHIGAPKTATSTLQSIFSKKYRKLLKNGVLYPRAGRHGDAHHLLVCDLIEKYQGHRMADFWYGDSERGGAWQALREDIDSHGDNIHSVIVSSELFFGQTKNIDQMHDEIKASLAGHEIKIVVYLRRQDQLYSSFFNQDVKGVRQWAHSAYQFYDTHQIFEHDYHGLLKIWSEPFGKENVLIRPYESEQWPDNDIVLDFCESLDIIRLKSGRVSSNKALGVNQLYFKQCLNRVGFEKALNDEVVELLTRVLPEEPAKECLYIRKRLYRQLRKGWLKVNQKLEQEFLQGQTLFHKDIPLPGALNLYSTDKKAVSDCLTIIINKIRAGGFGAHNPLFAKAALLVLAEQDLWSTLANDSRVALMELV